MSLADETPTNVVESIVRDGVQSQRDQGLVPNVRQVTDFVRDVVERLDRKRAESSHTPPQPKPHKVKTGRELRTEYEKRIRRAGRDPLPGEWTVKRDPIVSQRQIVDPRRFRTRGVDLIAKRIRQLRLDPEWREKLKGPAAALKGASTKEARDRALAAIEKLIEKSNATFGDWRKPKAKPLFFNV